MDTTVRTASGQLRGTSIDGLDGFLGVCDATRHGPEPPQPRFDRNDRIRR